jgi:transposase InsO family protein
MIILLYHSNMLSPEQLAQIPRTTQYNWKNFQHEDQFGFEMAQRYIEDFDHIKAVLVSKHLLRATKFMCTLSSGYKKVMADVEGSKKLARRHAKDVTYSITQLVRLGKMKVTEACRLLGVSKDWYYQHREKVACKASKIGKCFRQYPNQLTMHEVAVIESIVTDPNHYGKAMRTLYYDAIRNKNVTCGPSTFSKYAKICGYKKRGKAERKQRKKGFRASRAFESLHVDITLVQTKNDGVQRVAFVKDNFSKAILGYASTNGSARSSFIRGLFEDVFDQYDLLNGRDAINILSDGGSENKGSLLQWINQTEAPPLVRKITANTPEFEFTHSMAESTHSIYKTEFMRKRFSLDEPHDIKNIERFVRYYNHERFPCEHFGYSPMEVLEGAKPNRYLFSQQIGEARKDRVLKNQAFN